MEEWIIRSKVGGKYRKYGFINYRKIGGSCGLSGVPQEIRLVFINRYGSRKMSGNVRKMFNEIKDIISKYYDLSNIAKSNTTHTQTRKTKGDAK